MNRTFIEAAIVVDQINSIALPTDANLKSGKDNVVLVLIKTDDHSYNVRKKKRNSRTYFQWLYGNNK